MLDEVVRRRTSFLTAKPVTTDKGALLGAVPRFLLIFKFQGTYGFASV